MKKETVELLSILNDSTSTTHLDTYIEELDKKNMHLDVSIFLEAMLENMQLRKSDVIAASQLDRTYAYQIFNGTRTGSRNKILSLCIAMGLSLENVNRALTLNGNNILYAKNKRDAIIIFCIQKQKSLHETNILLEERKEEILTV